MKSKFTALLLILALLCGLVPGAQAIAPTSHLEPKPLVEGVCTHTLRECVFSPDYTRPDFNGKLIEITPQRVRDTFAYLDEHYIRNCPQAALEINTGSEADRLALKALAEQITKSCRTNKEKADAIDDWLRRNLTYEEQSSAYASDTFFERKGNCLSYANLMQYLLRLLGIPAVVGDGWRGNMAESTVDLFNYAGHAWCFVYIDGKWELYDPLWIDGGTTDRKYIEQWIYLDTVEFVTPASNGNKLPPEAYDKPKIYYTNGTFYNYCQSLPTGVGNCSYYINNMLINFTPCQDEQSTGGSTDGIMYLDGRGKEGMKLGEVYRNGWISYGDALKNRHGALTHAYSNGMQVSGSVDIWNNNLYFMSGFRSYPIQAEAGSWSIRYGTFTLPVGYTGKYFGLPWGMDVIDGDEILTIESLNPDVATVDSNNVITTVSEGFCDIQYTHTSADGALYGRCFGTVYVTKDIRTPSYIDVHEHRYQTKVHPASCTQSGYTEECCSLCGYNFTTAVAPVLGHGWVGTECSRCAATREIPFSDVPESKYYYDPIVWAYKNDITSGTSADKFSPNADCTRGQIVTFLWRAAGQPEPKTTNNPFTDVDSGDYYYKAVLWAVENGITNGATPTTFNPKGACDRAQVVTFMWRAAGKPAPRDTGNPFLDVAKEKYYHDAVLWAVEKGITNGTSAVRFSPNNACNRGQIVTFLYRGYAKP